MKDFIKKSAKGAASVGGSAIKSAISGILADIVSDIIKETGVKDIAKEKLMDTGFKVFKDMGMDPKKVQRDLLKNAIKKELGL